jgi:TRAP transporter TAXI family solute receptor
MTTPSFRLHDRIVRSLGAILILLMILSPAIIPPVNVAVAAKAKETARISVLVATGMPGDTYYQVGLGMASLWTTKLRREGIRVSAAISEGSLENIEAIRIADADLILAESFFSSMAHAGTGIYKGKPLQELRSITTLWPDVVHFLLRSEAISTGTLADLQGLTVATGLPDSGNRFTTEKLLGSLKSGGKGVRLRSMSNMAAAEALRNGTVQALNATGGIPVPLVRQLLGAKSPSLGLLEISESRVKYLREVGWGHMIRTIIPSGTYPGQSHSIRSVGFPNLLATTSSLPRHVVYALTKTLYENLDYLAKVHPACRQIDLDRALSGLEVPLHPGAVEYYLERNIDIPEHLLPRQ